VRVFFLVAFATACSNGQPPPIGDSDGGPPPYTDDAFVPIYIDAGDAGAALELDFAGACQSQGLVPVWRFFDFQTHTPLDSAPVMRPGDVLNMRCTYDNSMDNRFVRTALDQQGLDVPIDVGLGETTLDEMCLGVFGVALE